MNDDQPELLGAVADIISEEAAARGAALRELSADLNRQRERIDEYGNVIKTQFAGLTIDLRRELTDFAATLQGPQGERGTQGEAGPRGGDGAPGAAGSDGAPGTSPPPWQHQRAYDPAREYKWGDVVAHDGGSSVAIADPPGPLPGDGWAQLTQRGKPGRPGDKGPRGEKGADGVGIDDVFLENGRLVVLLTDGRIKDFELPGTLVAA